jgi:hypothetical protein
MINKTINPNTPENTGELVQDVEEYMAREAGKDWRDKLS